MYFIKADEEFLHFYLENGFAVLKQTLKPADFFLLKNAMNEAAQFCFKKNKITNDSQWPVDGKITGGLPHQALSELYLKAKPDFCGLWDINRLLLGVHQLTTNPAILGVLQVLGIKVPALEVFPAMRIDMPKDDNRNIPWHQEWRYGQGSLNSLTFWVPLTSVSEAMGPLSIVPGSHQFGLLDIYPVDKIHFYEIGDKKLDTKNSKSVEVEYGDVVIFSNFIAHQSGLNRSDRCRYSLQYRFNDLSCPYFLKRNWPKAYDIVPKKAMTDTNRKDSEIMFQSYLT